MPKRDTVNLTLSPSLKTSYWFRKELVKFVRSLSILVVVSVTTMFFFIDLKSFWRRLGRM